MKLFPKKKLKKTLRKLSYFVKRRHICYIHHHISYCFQSRHLWGHSSEGATCFYTLTHDIHKFYPSLVCYQHGYHLSPQNLLSVDNLFYLLAYLIHVLRKSPIESVRLFLQKRDKKKY